jgi:acetylglutamate kinase
MSKLDDMLNITPYGSVIVLKLSGKLLNGEEKVRETSQAISLAYSELASVFSPLASLVIVHGAGPQLDEALAANSFEKKIIDGVRYTTPEMMELIEDVTFSVSSDLESELAGIFGTHVVSSGYGLVTAESMGEKYGRRAGMPFSFEYEAEPDNMYCLDRITVLPAIARGIDGKLYNVNADHMAGFFAAKINYVTCYLAVGDEGGVLKNVNDRASVISKLTLLEFASMPLSGGMIPRREGMAYFLTHTYNSRAFISSSVDLNSVLEGKSRSTEILRS